MDDSMRQWVRRLNLAINRIDGLYDQDARNRNISDDQLCLLYALDDGQRHWQKEISEGWLIPKTTLNTIVKKLEAEGLVTLRAIPGHRRERELCLTQAGLAYAKTVLTPVYEAEAAAMERMLAEDPPDFIEALERYGVYFQDAFAAQNHTECEFD